MSRYEGLTADRCYRCKKEEECSNLVSNFMGCPEYVCDPCFEVVKKNTKEEDDRRAKLTKEERDKEDFENTRQLVHWLDNLPVPTKEEIERIEKEMEGGGYLVPPPAGAVSIQVTEDDF